MKINGQHFIVWIFALFVLSACNRKDQSIIAARERLSDDFIAFYGSTLFSINPKNQQLTVYDEDAQKVVLQTKIEFPEDEVPVQLAVLSGDTFLISYIYSTIVYKIVANAVVELQVLDNTTLFPGYVISCSEFRRRPVYYKGSLIFPLLDTTNLFSTQPEGLAFGIYSLQKKVAALLPYRHPIAMADLGNGDRGFGFSIYGGTLLITYSGIDSVYMFDLERSQLKRQFLNLITNSASIPPLLISDTFFNNLCEDDIMLKKMAFSPSIYNCVYQSHKGCYKVIFKEVDYDQKMKRYPTPGDLIWKSSIFTSNFEKKAQHNFGDRYLMQTVYIKDKERFLLKTSSYSQLILE
ncbi:MAG: hypothetical protein U0T73_14220 [Chitinophagales bacterium]